MHVEHPLIVLVFGKRVLGELFCTFYLALVYIVIVYHFLTLQSLIQNDNENVLHLMGKIK